jgi:hypothetical protein
MGNGLEIWVEDTTFCIDCLAVTVIVGRGVESLG